MRSKGLIFSIAVLLLGSTIVFSQTADEKKAVKELNGGNAKIRLEAIQKLAGSGTESSCSALIDRLAGEKDNYLRIQIIEALTVYQSTGALYAVLNGFNDNNSSVRQAAAINLGYFSSENIIVPKLEEVINRQGAENVKFSAVNALGRFKGSVAVSALERILSGTGSNEKMRIQAAVSLKKIGTKETKNILKNHANDKNPEIRKIANMVDKEAVKGKK